MVPPLLESDVANIEERTTMAVNEEQTINDQCNNIVSRGDEKDKHQGIEWWDRRYKPIKFLINCVASKKAYGNMRHYLNKVKGFGDDNIVFPLYVQQQKYYVFLSRFWYKIPEDDEDNNKNKLGYFEERNKVCGILFIFTVKKCNIVNLDNFKIKKLYDHKNIWSRIESGDKNNSLIHNNVH